MASVLYVLHLTIPVDMYFISVSAIKALFVLLLILITFWMKWRLFPLLTTYKIQDARKIGSSLSAKGTRNLSTDQCNKRKSF